MVVGIENAELLTELVVRAGIEKLEAEDDFEDVTVGIEKLVDDELGFASVGMENEELCPD